MSAPCQRWAFAVALLLLAACKNWRPAVFLQRTPRETHAAALDAHPGRSSWEADADLALRHPTAVSLPYREQGAIPGWVNGAAALQFDIRQGEQLVARAEGQPGPFLELYESLPSGPRRLLSPERGARLIYTAREHARCLLLIQGRLDSGADYILRIELRPSLAYPAPDPGKHRIGSVWGDSRDAGARRHEGVDIFAPKGSPALAAAPGRITRVTNGGLGGKTVWLRPDEQPVSLYYAHLDSQWVREGDYVRPGDTLGQIGNTGNARFTAAHLHFGVYTASGAVDPAPFIRPRDTAAPRIRVPGTVLDTGRRVRNAVSLLGRPAADAAVIVEIAAGTSIRILAISRDYMRIRAADTLTGWLRFQPNLLK